MTETSTNTGPKTAVLVGNPNVGKSVLFKNLTNHYVTVLNYPGTTVEIIEAKATFGFMATVSPFLILLFNLALLKLGKTRWGFIAVKPLFALCVTVFLASVSFGAAWIQFRGVLLHLPWAFAIGPLAALVIATAAMRELPHWIGEEGESLASRVRDVCEWLDEVGLRPPPGRITARVCYDDPCHLVHGQKVDAAPRRLLGSIDGIELVAHEDAARCCGAAGTYNLMQPELSSQILDEKMQSLAAAAPDVVATGNPGCLLQIRAGAEQRGLAMRVVHPVELLAEAYASR